MILIIISFIYSGDRASAIKDVQNIPEPAAKTYYTGILQKNPLSGMKHFERVITRYGNTPWADSAIFRIGMYYYTMEDLDQSIHFLKMIINKHPASSMKPLCNFWLGTIYLLRGDTATASQYLQKTKVGSEGGILSRIDIKNIEGENLKEVYTVQIGAYTELKWAKNRQSEMKEKGYDAEIHPVKTDGKIIFKLTIGRFSAREQTFDLVKILKEQEHIDCWIAKIWVH